MQAPGSHLRVRGRCFHSSHDICLPRAQCHCKGGDGAAANFLPVFIFPFIHVSDYLVGPCVPRSETAFPAFLQVGAALWLRTRRWDTRKSITKQLLVPFPARQLVHTFARTLPTPTPHSTPLLFFGSWIYPAVWSVKATIAIPEKAGSPTGMAECEPEWFWVTKSFTEPRCPALLTPLHWLMAFGFLREREINVSLCQRFGGFCYLYLDPI